MLKEWVKRRSEDVAAESPTEDQKSAMVDQLWKSIARSTSNGEAKSEIRKFLFPEENNGHAAAAAAADAHAANLLDL